MKKVLIAIAAVLVSGSAFAQGFVNFRTHIASDTPPIDFKILNADGTAASGAFAQLGVLSGGSFTAMTEAPATVNVAGYVTAGNATFAGSAAGSTVSMVLRAWQGAAGSTYDTATIRGTSNPFQQSLTPNTTPPSPAVDLLGLGSGTLTLSVPEPTTLALGALGLGALLIRRRK